MSALVHAAPVRWTLSDVRFNDEGTVSGSFVFDASTGSLSSWNVSVAGGNVAAFPALSYTSSNGSAALDTSLGNPLPTIVFYLTGSFRQLRVTPNVALTNAGGTVALNLETAFGGSGGGNASIATRSAGSCPEA
ncbi:hypothetical protein [Tahibacter amnicola]|uniref:Uncharacterized protein n=1 Tax=Tahibacter amnicola TaxID=2976241 RepID=A0ABY6B9R9_9GAMM|nr:hypothetical protein [Tahibacter amnicola]UXI66813.1 hypothetical protein N4264_18945 [Tahibacter amnicola]